MARRTVFSSESVTAGHPDKMCDQVSDAIVDAFLYLDPDARVSAECTVATGLVFLAVRHAGDVSVDLAGVTRDVIADIGYSAQLGFDPATCSVITSVARKRSSGRGQPRGVSSQASVFGFACTDTPERMPLPISLAHRLARRLDDVRRDRTLAYLAPDGKTLVAVEFEDRTPVRVHTVIVNVQHTAALRDAGNEDSHTRLEQELREVVLEPVFATSPVVMDARTRVLINPRGEFIVGGPQRDSGLTGRKGAVDTYGGYARQGGGALSGKDPSHADRLGAYAARYVARNVVAAGLARQCEVHLSYAVGETDPLAVSIETFGTGLVPADVLERAVAETIDLRPGAMLERLDLCRLPMRHGGTFFRRLAVYGHFGRTDLDLPWEREDQAVALERAASAIPSAM